MRVDISQASPHQTMSLYKRQYFLVSSHTRAGQAPEVFHNFTPWIQVSARQLAQNKRVQEHLPLFQ